MPRPEPYVPLHREDPQPTAPGGRARRSPLTLAAAALTTTALAVSAGVVLEGSGSAAPTSAAASVTSAGPVVGANRAAPGRVDESRADRSRADRSRVGPGRLDLGDRSVSVSRSDRRTAVDPTKKAALDQRSGGQVTRTEKIVPRDPRSVARAMLPQFGFGSDQFSCLDSIYVGESGWNVHADNPSSSAYGIPQALPGSKMASAGPKWRDDAATQIRWGLGYIKARYGTPCSAWSFKQGHGWY